MIPVIVFAVAALAIGVGIVAVDDDDAQTEVSAETTTTAQPTTSTEDTAPETAPAPEAEPAWETDAPDPATVTIPSIDVEAPVIDLWLNPDDTLQTPKDFSETGWWAGGSGVGEAGPALIAGHVDSFRGPAVFFRLDELDVGDEAHVTRDDGTTATFVVYDKQRVDKDQFPTDRVYGDTEVPELRLVTCGGAFDSSERSYEDNVIVYLKIAGADELA